MNKDILKLLKERYFSGNESSWEDLCQRIYTIYPDILNYLLNMEFIPSSPTLMNWNCSRTGTLSSCFPMAIEDSIEEIFKSLSDAARVTKFCGGIGFDFSYLRSSEEDVKGIGNRKSSGPIPFIQIYNSMLDGVSQGGSRRGAGMAMLDITHPDIIKFIEAKKDFNDNRFNRFNFSVRIPNWFYDELKSNPDKPFSVKNIKNDLSYYLEHNGSIITYKQLWDKIIEISWYCADPGIFNSDIAHERCSVTNYDYRVLSNPCAEFVNIPYSACSLGSINLSSLVKDKKFNMEKFENICIKSTRFLDNTIDVNNYPLEKIKKVNEDIRPIGLGFMGIAHAMMKMGISYISQEGKSFVEYISRMLTYFSMKESIQIAKEKGRYNAFDFEVFIKANKRFFDHDIFEKLIPDIKKHGVRNSCFTSIAPTGSISFIANTSSGIEPVYALCYSRKIEKGKDQSGKIIYENVDIVDSVFYEYIKNRKDKEEIISDIIKNNGSCQKCKFLTNEEKLIFLTAKDISPNDHLSVLSYCANNISLSCSKTINMKSDAKKEDISDVFIAAKEMGIIGVTVYREGSKEGILVTNKVENSKIIKTNAPKRPKELYAELHHINLKKQKFYVAVGMYNDQPIEVFTGLNYDSEGNVYIPSTIKEGKIIKVSSGKYVFKNGNDIEYELLGYHFNESAESLTRQISLSLRHGTDIVYIIEQLQKIKSGDMFSFSHVLARTLKKYIPDNTKSTNKCIECGNNMIYESSCVKCPACGWSKC